MPKSTRQRTLQREARAWALRTQGWSEISIAAELGVTQQAVSLMIGRVEKRLNEKLTDLALRVKLEQHHRYDHIIQEAMTAWENSKKSRSRTKVKDLVNQQNIQQGTQGTILERETEVEQRDPAAGFLQVAMQAMAEQRKIWGIDKEDAPDMGGPMTQPIRTVHINLPPQIIDGKLSDGSNGDD